MATVFLRAHPPESPILAQYGKRFPGFLQSFGPVRHLPYLPDMARLELGLRQSYHAADAAPLDISGIAPERVMDLRPRMAHASLVLRSRFPILSIWRINRFDLHERITMTPQDVLITRINYDPAPHLLAVGGIDLARHLKGRMSLSDAAMAALAIEPQADLAALLQLFLTTSALTLDEGLIP